MRLRPPSVPLITVDPYFSVWSPADRLTDSVTVHWTGKPNTIVGTAEIDGTAYRFLGKLNRADNTPVLSQTAYDCDTFSTYYTFEGAGIVLNLTFSTPLLMDDLDIMTRPVSYLKAEVKSADGACHTVKVKIAVSEEICLNCRGEDTVVCEVVENDTFRAAKIGSEKQPVLAVSGDDIRINWGYFYLTVPNGRAYTETVKVPFVPNHRSESAPEGFRETMTFACVETELKTCCANSTLITFAYDDVKSIEYFGDHLTSYWNRNGKTIVEAIAEAYADYDCVMAKCKAFADRLFIDATRAGGEKYAEICELSYRQAIAAHKVAVDTEGQILFISKECFSNGCAATVDVSYPSIPLFLLYNPELVCGMMRPIYKYARTDGWIFDFAPHDCGQYPLVHGQVYAGNHIDGQMPVEECGNMLVMAASVAIASGCTKFAEENLDLLEAWVKYLEAHGDDPENQLCTDDFAGHLAHNCNLSLKAVMGIAGLGILYKMLGRENDGSAMIAKAKKMAEGWAVRAANGDGSYRLAFDRPGTWSMKYNIVWDKLFGTGVMDKGVVATEFASYKHHINHYGMPLDNRETYTKSDWLIWTATLAEDRGDFEEYVAPLWENYNCTLSRVPMTDWYYTVTSNQRGFQHRTVVGGHFIKLLEYSGKMKNWMK
ncbi:MAG: glutaminase domain-containing protein [Eubacteriales bacterium]